MDCLIAEKDVMQHYLTPTICWNGSFTLLHLSEEGCYSL